MTSTLHTFFSHIMVVFPYSTLATSLVLVSTCIIACHSKFISSAITRRKMRIHPCFSCSKWHLFHVFIKSTQFYTTSTWLVHSPTCWKLETIQTQTPDFYSSTDYRKWDRVFLISLGFRINDRGQKVKSTKTDYGEKDF